MIHTATTAGTTAVSHASFSFVGEYWVSAATNEIDHERQSESQSTRNDTDSAVKELFQNRAQNARGKIDP